MNFKHLSLLLLILIASLSFAAPSFTVQKIEIDGLARISERTVLSYLPLKVGEQLTDSKSNKIINALYATQFFSHISLAHTGNTLIVKVEERPVMSSINIIGNKELPKDKLDEALKKMNFVQGAVFDQATLEQVKQALAEQYYSMGRYSAKITETIKVEPRHRVAITLDVSEGMAAKVMKITILGNTVFSESTLKSQLLLAPPNWLSFFTSKDQYAKEKLDKSLEALQTYYLNRGYLEMRVDSTQVTVTPDKKFVYVVLHVKEGHLYHFSGFDLTGDLILSKADLSAAVPIKSGEIFSRQVVLDSSKGLTTKLGDKGYAFAKVNVKPKVDAEKHTVFLDFEIEPGSIYYVRHIYFTGNSATSNIALRNILTQFEGGLYSTTKIEQSTRNLRQLPYLKSDEMEVVPTPVPGSNNKVDLDVKVKEKSSAEFQFSVGYSQAYGFLITTGVTQSNFLGTGKTVGINFNRSAFQTGYSLSYLDPFYTYNGVSRSMQLFYQKTQPGSVIGGNNAGYSVTSLGFSDIFGFPLSNYQQFHLGYNLQYTKLQTGSSPSTQVASFTNSYGYMYDQLILVTGWSSNTLDRFQLPTKGVRQGVDLNVSVPVNKNNLEYYKLTYQNRAYQPISESGFILMGNGIAGYGNGYGRFSGLPFLQNYYAGGIGTQGQNRAYLPSSLGPLDSNNQPLGGNLLLSTTASLIVPTLLNKYNVRTSVFLDAGSVFNTTTTSWQPPNSVSLKNLRYSYGFQVEWWTPLGMPLIFSLAQPLNNKPGDNIMLFQFNIGGSF